MESEALLKWGFGSAEGWTSVRARVARGKRGGSDSRLRRACSFVELLAFCGCGDGSFSSGNAYRGGGFLTSAGTEGFGGVDAEPDSSDNRSEAFGAATVLLKRILWLCGVVFGAIVVAAEGQVGRRGRWFASSCEAHRETGIRFIKEKWRGLDSGRRPGTSSSGNWACRVCYWC